MRVAIRKARLLMPSAYAPVTLMTYVRSRQLPLDARYGQYLLRFRLILLPPYAYADMMPYDVTLLRYAIDATITALH